MVGPRLLIAGLNSLFVFGLFVLGFACARETVAVFLGLGAGLASATFWALASIFAEPEHNLRLNLFAAWVRRWIARVSLARAVDLRRAPPSAGLPVAADRGSQ